MEQKALVDFTDKELETALRNSVEHVQYFAANYREEMFRRSQESHTKAMNRWTAITALATLVNTIAAILLVLKTIGWI